MKVPTFLVLSTVTVGMVVAAGMAVVRQQPYEPSVAVGQKVFPSLPEKLEALAAVTIRDAKSSLTVERRDDGWALKMNGGYPVEVENLRGTILQLVDLEYAEAKTQNPKQFAQLRVEDVDSEGAQSKEIELLDNDGTVLARLVVGKASLDFGEAGGVYVRKPEENRAWLARGRLDPGLKPDDWVVRRIADIPSTDVREIRIVHPDKETIVAARSSPDDEHLALKNLPETVVPKTPDAADSLASILSALDLEDIRPQSELAFGSNETTRITVSTFDGLIVSIDLLEIEGGNWMRLSAQSRSTSAPDEEGENKAQRNAAKINELTKGWAYRVPAHRVAPLEKRLSDLVTPVEPPKS
jgi:hypothetical protein